MKKLPFIFLALLFSSCLTEKRLNKLCSISKIYCPISIDTITSIRIDTIFETEIEIDTVYFSEIIREIGDTIIQGGKVYISLSEADIRRIGKLLKAKTIKITKYITKTIYKPLKVTERKNTKLGIITQIIVGIELLLLIIIVIVTLTRKKLKFKQ